MKGGDRMRVRLSFRRVVIAAALAEAGLLLGLLVYLAASERVLVVSFATRESLRADRPAEMVVPVAGVRRSDLTDTYGAARSGGRAHKGVDIFAPRGTPVIAAAAGTIVKRDSSAAGGLSVYQRDPDGRTIYYYAHLDRWRAGLKEGDLVRQGDVIGYVGSTGNVSGAPHLHFAVFVVNDPNQWWRGRDLNPYQVLRGASPADTS